MMNVITKATKKSAVLAKAIVPRRYPRVEYDDGSGPSHSRDRRGYERSRDRSRSRSPAKSKRNDRKDFRKYRYSKKSKKNEGKGAAKDSHDSKN